jgi:hypothetical protein
MSDRITAGDPTLLPTPELQFIDANGNPYAGGTLALYVPGTTTPKNSWEDWQGTVLNTNPIILDAAGRCIVWGDGDYRCILHDSVGNLIFDQISTTLVSAAMVPVVSAPDLASARQAMGITDAIAVETNRALAAEQAIVNGLTIYAKEADLTAEVTRAEAAEATLQSNIDAEKARAMAAEAALGTSSVAAMRVGFGATDASGNASVTFSTPFPNSCDGVVATAGVDCWVNPTTRTASGFSCTTSSPLFGGNWVKGPMGFFFIAFGH